MHCIHVDIVRKQRKRLTFAYTLRISGVRVTFTLVLDKQKLHVAFVRYVFVLIKRVRVLRYIHIM